LVDWIEYWTSGLRSWLISCSLTFWRHVAIVPSSLRGAVTSRWTSWNMVSRSRTDALAWTDSVVSPISALAVARLPASSLPSSSASWSPNPLIAAMSSANRALANSLSLAIASPPGEVPSSDTSSAW
jgi:hypothetical protein